MKKRLSTLALLLLLAAASAKARVLPKQDSIPVFNDMLYEYRFAVLDKKTPLDLEYNQLVKKYIELYTIERRKDLSRIMGLSKLYFPIFESYLDKYDLPLELKYLSVVESSLDPTAKSSSGAIGLWQFLYNSAGMFNLEITSYVDDRRDVYKSTDAACRYFKYLYQTFHDWHLVLAAYNGGPGVVRTAIERSGGKTNLWEILPYLPEPTQNYVPAFLAMNYIMFYANDFKIEAQASDFDFAQLDTIYVDGGVSFAQIAENIKITPDHLRFLNPRYKLDVIPETGQKQLLTLPQELVKPYLVYETAILSTKTKAPTTKEKLHKVSYKVERGDFLHKIAIKYNCRPEDIREWNHLSSDFISPGQTLIIFVESTE